MKRKRKNSHAVALGRLGGFTRLARRLASLRTVAWSKAAGRELPPASMRDVRAPAVAKNHRSDCVNSRSVRAQRHRPGPPGASLCGRAKCAYGLILPSSRNCGAGG